MATSAPDRAPGHLRADARRNRARLLEVAHAAFMAGGVMASMDDIARRSGVGIGTLYRHFPTREDLVLALVADDLERLAARPTSSGPPMRPTASDNGSASSCSTT